MRTTTRILFAAMLATGLTLQARAQDSPAAKPEETGEEAPATPSNQPPAPGGKAEPTPPEVVPHPGRDKFVAAARVIEDATSISYHCRSAARGGLLEGLTPVVDSDVTQIRATGGTLPGWRVRVTGQSKPKSGTPTDFDVAWLVGTVEFVDHVNRKVVEVPPPDARRNKAFTIASSGRLEEMTAMRPFAKEIAATEYSLEGRETVGGVECEVIGVTTGKIRGRWWIAVEDNLPRKMERLVGGRDGDAALVWEVSGLRLNAAPQGSAQNLRVAVPDGYTEDRPVRSAVAPPKEAAPNTATPVETAATSPTTPPPAPAGPRPAPEFELSTPEGQKVSLSSLRGTVVVLEFGGSWAVTLRDSRPEFDRFLKDHKDAPVRGYSLAVREKEDENAVTEYRRPRQGAGPHEFALLLRADEVARAYRVMTYPSYAVVDRRGLLVLEPGPYVKGETLAQVRRAVEAALREEAGPSGQ